MNRIVKNRKIQAGHVMSIIDVPSYPEYEGCICVISGTGYSRQRLIHLQTLYIWVRRHIRSRLQWLIITLLLLQISRLESMAGKHNVAIAHKGPSLDITGRVRNVAEVHEKIVELFQTEATGALLKEEAKLVANLVEWMYVAGGKSRPFTPGLNCCLEKAYKAKEKSLEIKDARGRIYSVDFQKMTEMPKAGGKPIKIERLEKVSGMNQ